MSDLDRLLQFGPQVLEAIYTSTACAPVNREAAEFFAQHLAAAEGRAEAARERSRERSAAIRAGIVKAMGALPPTDRRTPASIVRRIENRGPEFYAMRRVPDIETVRAVVREKSSESGTEPRTCAAEPQAESNRQSNGTATK